VISALLSQVISNVPAAVMLAGFTNNGTKLLLGVNLGGLGTMIASLASLISFQFYRKSEGAKIGRYFAVFTAINFGMLALLLIFELLIRS
jgi:Na+/H+ antiporter NhaD/arsenite permease-like protein